MTRDRPKAADGAPGRGSGVSRRDLFGDAVAAEVATPGSYGLPPEGFRLPPGTRLGPVRLQVADLERSLAFYERVLGLQPLRREASRVLLGTRLPEPPQEPPQEPREEPAGEARPGAAPLVELVERRQARPAPYRGRTGLFHFAILLPDPAALGRFARHLAELGARAGTADHLVSRSFYLQDPDNLGIEVYADRPRSAWRRLGRELMMATDPLDVAALVAAAGGEPWRGMPAGTVMGHVHLHVGDLAAAAGFYSQGLGFDRTVWGYPGALFLAADGYHHHLGTNLWAGEGATPPAADEAQLLEWTLELPDGGSVTAAADSLAARGFAVEAAASARGVATTARDPWGTALRLHAR